MNFGKFDRQLLLQRPAVVAQNDFGESAPAGFEDVATVWGEQKPGTGAESVIGQQQTAQQAANWQIRYRADITPTWQFVCEGHTYQIIAIQEVGRRAGLLLTTYSRG
ncbi:head-tail adaptor protein [Hymenobacter setariae]|uniref:Head-tail adaptor protein n=1 Tax=Hymenobacter setariae TaxID=2594794 RepID=A0A558BT10_9BACT|nr:phage head closure protein [Hymenobacter setariae]TVT39631.1 head-tail adaptor protein [Hymenobacter setariae]